MLLSLSYLADITIEDCPMFELSKDVDGTFKLYYSDPQNYEEDTKGSVWNTSLYSNYASKPNSIVDLSNLFFIPGQALQL